MDKITPILNEIKSDISEIKADIRYHIKRTDMLEKEVDESKQHRNEVLQIVVKQAEKARQDQLKVIKITIGVFAALAALVSALAAWLAN